MNIESISLTELNLRIKDAIGHAFMEPLWVVAEISEIHVNNSGHCYLELIEKDQKGDRILSKIRATIWAFTFRMIKPYFEQSTQYELSAGLKVMLKVKIEYHEIYGISLNIKDINPTYTLGDFARKRQEIIARLQQEGVFDMNRELDIPIAPQRIAVISSKTAAGYGDFTGSLENNAFGLKFYVSFFAAIVQGDQAESSIMAAFEQIYQTIENFDLVVLIRGGGSQSDLECFNSYELAYLITQFPIPVITGIGHERDVSIVDLVAHTSLKTPTAVASWLIESLAFFLGSLENFEKAIIKYSREIMLKNRHILATQQKMLQIMTSSRLSEQEHFLDASQKTLASSGRRIIQGHHKGMDHALRLIHLQSISFITKTKREIQRLELRLQSGTLHFFQSNREKINTFERTIGHLDPLLVLKRGFSISIHKGKALKTNDFIKDGDTLTTILYKGKISSKITIKNEQKGN